MPFTGLLWQPYRKQIYSTKFNMKRRCHRTDGYSFVGFYIMLNGKFNSVSFDLLSLTRLCMSWGTGYANFTRVYSPRTSGELSFFFFFYKKCTWVKRQCNMKSNSIVSISFLCVTIRPQLFSVSSIIVTNERNRNLNIQIPMRTANMGHALLFM